MSANFKNKFKHLHLVLHLVTFLSFILTSSKVYSDSGEKVLNAIMADREMGLNDADKKSKKSDKKTKKHSIASEESSLNIEELIKYIEESESKKLNGDEKEDNSILNYKELNFNQISQQIVEELKKEKRENETVTPHSIDELTKLQRKFKEEHPGFEKSHDTFLLLSTSAQGKRKYNKSMAPDKIGIMSPPATGKSTYISDFIKLINLPSSYVHHLQINDDQIEFPLEKIKELGVLPGEETFPHVVVLDGLFKMKKYSDLSSAERQRRKSSIQNVTNLLRDGEDIIYYKTKPQDAYTKLISSLEKKYNFQLKLNKLDFEITKLKEKLKLLTKDLEENIESKKVPPLLDQNEKKVVLDFNNKNFSTSFRSFFTTYTTMTSSDPSVMNTLIVKATTNGQGKKVRANLLDSIDNNKIVATLDFEGIHNLCERNKMQTEEPFISFYKDQIKGLCDTVYSLGQMDYFGPSLNQLLTNLNDELNKSIQVIGKTEKNPEVVQLENEIAKKRSEIVVINKSVSVEDTALQTVFNTITNEYPKLLGSFSIYTPKTLFLSFYKDYKTVLNYLAENLITLPPEGVRKLFNHVTLIYAGVPPIYNDINTYFKKNLPPNAQTLENYLTLVGKHFPNPEEYLTSWAKKDLLEDLSDASILELGFNKNFMSIPPFKRVEWKKIVSHEISEIFKDVYLKITKIPEDRHHLFNLSVDDSLINIIINEASEPTMGRRNLKPIIGKFLNGILLNLAKKLNERYLANENSSLDINLNPIHNGMTTFIKYSNSTKTLFAYEKIKNEPDTLLAEFNIKDYIDDDDIDLDQPNTTKETLEDAIFMDVMSRQMGSLPKILPPKEHIKIDELKDYWNIEQVDFVSNFRKFLIATVAKKMALKILFPKDLFSTNDENEDNLLDKTILETVRSIRKQLHSIVEQHYGDWKLSPIYQDSLFTSIYNLTESDFKSKTPFYKNIIRRVELYSSLRVAENRKFIFLLQKRFKEEKLKNMSDVYDFYDERFPRYTLFSLKEYFKDTTYLNKDNKVKRVNVDKINDYEYMGDWMKMAEELLTNSRGYIKDSLNAKVVECNTYQPTLWDKFKVVIKKTLNSMGPFTLFSKESLRDADAMDTTPNNYVHPVDKSKLLFEAEKTPTKRSRNDEEEDSSKIKRFKE